MQDGKAVDIDPIAAMFNPAWGPEAIHMAIAAYQATAFGVAGVHAFLLLRDRQNLFHRRALAIALSVGAIAAVLQPISGDSLARFLAQNQPIKLAALEGHFHTQRGAPLHIGGLPDEDTQTMRFALKIPKGLSLLAFHDPDAEVRGLEEWPAEIHPPVAVVHIAFQIMVGCGVSLLGVVVWGGILMVNARRRAKVWKLPDNKWFLRALVAAAPLGFLAIEAGWTVTEVGRQPFIIQGILRTADAVTPVPNLTIPLITFTIVYLFLGFVVVYLLLRQFRMSPRIPAPGSARPQGAEKESHARAR